MTSLLYIQSFSCLASYFRRNITEGDEDKILNQFENKSVSPWIPLGHKVAFDEQKKMPDHLMFMYVKRAQFRCAKYCLLP